MKKKTALTYFSPTGNTAKMARYIKKKLINFEKNLQIDEYDITPHSKRQEKIKIEQYDSCFFGFPIYAWRAPKIARDWLRTLEGNGIKCSVFFTYGGVDPGAAHYNIQQILNAQNFNLVSTAEFVCEHTYNCGGWNVMINRPNKLDFKIADEYIKETWKRLKSEVYEIIQIENPKISERILFRLENDVKRVMEPPSRRGADCSLCEACESRCPANAMSFETGDVDTDLCIRCYSCFINCPDKALKINDLNSIYQLFSKLERLGVDESTVYSKYYI
ncbi:MAG: 4Fe-4S ferredoxin [Candidatus Lokiarchaeota archaeon]|nr:4Fe-4S ferredoxin [Candidatus Lokiarchaeota archaeon]